MKSTNHVFLPSLIGLLLACMFVSRNPVSSTLVTYDFSGTIPGIESGGGGPPTDALFRDLPLGTPLSGAFAYNVAIRGGPWPGHPNLWVGGHMT